MGFEGSVADEFVAWASSQLRANDHAILRGWRGNRSPRTFVVVMLTSLARESSARGADRRIGPSLAGCGA